MPANWPARPPNLSPLDSFLLRYVKQHVSNTNLDNTIEILKQKIKETVKCDTKDIIHNLYKEFARRAEKCVEVGVCRVE